VTDRLSPLQRRILETMAGLEPRWTLTGGGALAGVYLGHRPTRDLDLFWRERRSLGAIVADAQALLAEAGVDVALLRTSLTFAELRVSDATDVCIVDLVAEPFAAIEPPRQVSVGSAVIAVDSQHEILVAKLTTLLGRMELRDLVDVRALLDAGLDFDRALRDAPKKDGGFSAMTLAWVLEGFDLRPMASALGWSADETAKLDTFRLALIDRLVRISRPA